ncbi:Protein N-terminal glutamine amidohydrolase [Parelaphostrongylus tenuis]|uniref:Protein N-terminal glutamine amidohydrolase n=1 Tax=Parelaphostrongylus tenuis TaxID=148309 RepID=A0AAD5MDV7_PARTN|nr:Protein N-terminal glutamine amidohydrolase [Parelaphostrongylus tenuis]
MISEIGSREDCDYTKYYCEENVYRLCERIPVDKRQQFLVVFISNPSKCVPLFAQRASTERPFVMWDYHVILLQQIECGVTLIWDLDTLLSFPCSFDEYWNGTLRPPGWNIPENYSRYFRVIPCAHYITHFSSDRSHMKGEDGSWLAPPPVWAPIYRDGLNNIQEFISMDPNVLPQISTVMNEDDMFGKYSCC